VGLWWPLEKEGEKEEKDNIQKKAKKQNE